MPNDSLMPIMDAFNQGRLLAQNREMRQLQQVGALQKILSQARAEQEAQAFRGAIAQARTPEERAEIAARFGGPDAVMRVTQGSLDRKAALDAANMNREAMREQRIHEIKLRGEEAIEKLREAAAQQRITKEEADRREAAMRENLLRITASLRPEPQGRAPTYRDILDPLNPSRIITVNPEVYDETAYRAGNKAGVLGVAGKEPAAAKRDEQKEQGRKGLADAVSSISAAYDNLEADGAGVDPSKSAPKNVWERAAASGVGQTIAGFVGTKAQSERDKIASLRPAILAELKNATGMSAQQLNSNAELQFYIQMATDPARGMPSNRAALAYLDKKYNLGLGLKADPTVEAALARANPVRSGRINSPSTPAMPPGFTPD